MLKEITEEDILHTAVTRLAISIIVFCFVCYIASLSQILTTVQCAV